MHKPQSGMSLKIAISTIIGRSRTIITSDLEDLGVSIHTRRMKDKLCSVAKPGGFEWGGGL